MDNTLYQKNCKTGETSKFYPVTIIPNVIEESSGRHLDDLLRQVNHWYVPFKQNSRVLTRRQIPQSLRRKGLWITYLSCKNQIVTEYYNSDDFDDKEWGCQGNWVIVKSCTCDGSEGGSVDYNKVKDIVEDILKDMELPGGTLNEEWLTQFVTDIVENYLGDSEEIEILTEEDVKKIVNEILKNYKFPTDKDAVTDIVNDILKKYKFTGDNIDNSIIENIVNNYLEKNPPEGGGLSKEQIEKIIEDYLKEHPVDGSVDKETIEKLLEEIFKESTITDFFDKEELKEIIKEALGEMDLTDEIEKAIEKWTKENTEYFKEILQPMVDDAVGKAKEEILQELEEYLHNNERVIANSLARHEQAITELQV